VVRVTTSVEESIKELLECWLTDLHLGWVHRLMTLQRNHQLFRSGTQDRFVQRAWNSVGLTRGSRGGSQLIELYGKHLTYST
jgi:hypothetical protein